MFLILGIGKRENNTNAEITYNLAMSNKEITKSDTPKILKDVTFTLKCKPWESLFTFDKQKIDKYNANMRYVIKSGGKTTRYKNIKTKEKYYVMEGLLDKPALVNKNNKQDWIITKETKLISGYKVYKAYLTSKSRFNTKPSIKIIAWFTSEIPLPFGPVGYDGLPGLILQLEKNDFIFTASNIKLINSNSDINLEAPKGIKMTEKEAKNIFRKKTGVDFDKKMKQRALKKKKNE
tara:strand:+ start:2175 stop:2879 length:705 start_codon:yes stop_codon:yes gene_type:complete